MVITFSSVKGGVGKSTVTELELAKNLVASDKKALIINEDLNCPSTIYYTDEFTEQGGKSL